MPGDGRLVQAELVAEQLLHDEAAIANRGQGARGAGEFAEQDSRQCLVDTFDVPVDRR